MCIGTRKEVSGYSNCCKFKWNPAFPVESNAIVFEIEQREDLWGSSQPASRIACSVGAEAYFAKA